MLGTQNRGLRREVWKILDAREDANGWIVASALDDPSLENLQASNCLQGLCFNQITFRINGYLEGTGNRGTAPGVSASRSESIPNPLEESGPATSTQESVSGLTSRTHEPGNKNRGCTVCGFGCDVGPKESRAYARDSIMGGCTWPALAVSIAAQAAQTGTSAMDGAARSRRVTVVTLNKINNVKNSRDHAANPRCSRGQLRPPRSNRGQNRAWYFNPR